MGSNVELLKGLYEAFAKGDVPTVLGALDEKVDWQEPESLPFEDQIGPEAVAENIFGRVVQLVEGFSVTPDEILDAGDAVVALGTYRGKGAATGKDLEAKFAHVWRIREGKIAGFRTYTDTHQWLEALGQA